MSQIKIWKKSIRKAWIKTLMCIVPRLMKHSAGRYQMVEYKMEGVLRLPLKKRLMVLMLKDCRQ